MGPVQDRSELGHAKEDNAVGDELERAGLAGQATECGVAQEAAHQHDPEEPVGAYGVDAQHVERRVPIQMVDAVPHGQIER